MSEWFLLFSSPLRDSQLCCFPLRGPSIEGRHFDVHERFPSHPFRQFDWMDWRHSTSAAWWRKSTQQKYSCSSTIYFKTLGIQRWKLSQARTRLIRRETGPPLGSLASFRLFGWLSFPGHDLGHRSPEHVFAGARVPELDVGQQEGAHVLAEPVRVETPASDAQRQFGLLPDAAPHAPVEVAHRGLNQGGRQPTVLRQFHQRFAERPPQRRPPVTLAGHLIAIDLSCIGIGHSFKYQFPVVVPDWSVASDRPVLGLRFASINPLGCDPDGSALVDAVFWMKFMRMRLRPDEPIRPEENPPPSPSSQNTDAHVVKYDWWLHNEN